MTTISNLSHVAVSCPTSSGLFLTLLPRLERHARMFFRSTRCVHRRNDQLAEVVALCWLWYLRLSKRGKDVSTFPIVLAHYACRAICHGRRLAGQERVSDVLNPRTGQRHGFTVERLPVASRSSHEHLYARVAGQRRHNTYEERLHGNHLTPVPEQVAFRLDFAAWLATLSGRERQLVLAMAREERTKDLSRTFAVSPGRISQLRKEFHSAWQSFWGDLPPHQACPSR